MTPAVLLAALLLLALPARAELVEQSRWLMGTELRIVLETEGHSDSEIRVAFQDCFELAAACESVLSRWDPTAELARLNAAAGQSFPASPELFGWLQRCAADALRTGGAFDPTVGTWILHPGSEARIGMDRIALDAESLRTAETVLVLEVRE